MRTQNIYLFILVIIAYICGNCCLSHPNGICSYGQSVVWLSFVVKENGVIIKLKILFR